jgi:hypothetical protein
LLALLLACIACLYVIGLRADRIHAGRTVTQSKYLSINGTVTEPVARKGGVATAAEGTDAKPSGLGPGSVTAPVLYQGHTSHYWHRLAYLRGRRVRQLKRTLMTSPSVSEAINLAATVYGNGSLLWSLARCESTLDPGAKNASGSSGLMQFMPSTFASTPYGRFSIWSPYASAMAGGWMLAHGRRSEWVC